MLIQTDNLCAHTYSTHVNTIIIIIIKRKEKIQIIPNNYCIIKDIKILFKRLYAILKKPNRIVNEILEPYL